MIAVNSSDRSSLYFVAVSAVADLQKCFVGTVLVATAPKRCSLLVAAAVVLPAMNCLFVLECVLPMGLHLRSRDLEAELLGMSCEELVLGRNSARCLVEHGLSCEVNFLGCVLASGGS